MPLMDCEPMHRAAYINPTTTPQVDTGVRTGWQLDHRQQNQATEETGPLEIGQRAPKENERA